MKTILTILLGIAPFIIASAGDVQITTSTKTNLNTKAWRRIDVYKQDGHRILEIDKFCSLNGQVWTREQMVFWQDQVAVKLTTENIRSNHQERIQFYATPGIDAQAILNETGGVKYVLLANTNLELQAAFDLVEGVLSPLPTADLEKANSFTKDMAKTFGRFTQKKSTGEEFLGDIQAIQAKYGTTNGPNRPAVTDP